MSAFLRSVPGRLLTASGGFALTGGGIAVMLGPSFGIPVMCLSLLAGVVCGVFSVGIASSEWPAIALAAVLGLPIALFMYVLGVGLALEHGAIDVAVALVTVGLLGLARAALLNPGAAGARRPAFAAQAQHPAH